MDYSKPLGAEFRAVRDIEHDGQPAHTVEGSRLYSTSAEDLWQALTDPERLVRWFLPVSGELEVGGRYQLEGNAGGTITRCEPQETLELTWEFAGNVSWVSLTLTPESSGVRLSLVHTMLKDDASEEHWQSYGPGATGVGWDLSFFGLGLHLESGGESIDQEANNEWLTTDEAKTFIRGCAGAWGDAHSASGEAEESARAMADRTAAAYTGE